MDVWLAGWLDGLIDRVGRTDGWIGGWCVPRAAAGLVAAPAGAGACPGGGWCGARRVVTARVALHHLRPSVQCQAAGCARVASHGGRPETRLSVAARGGRPPIASRRNGESAAEAAGRTRICRGCRECHSRVRIGH
eukprot:scaffold2977_cov383-Prasinococcus_capsulatus_cf.AAC.1